jgi:uncharacterized protein YndB with AHSA1/START domain
MRAGTVAERRATVDAPAQALWDVIADPHHLPRWWPGVLRVEGVRDRHFTQVLTTRRGRPVRVDFEVTELQPLALAVWRQELAGSPFARVLSESHIRIELEPAGERTRVRIVQVQKLRGSSRTGGPMLRRATRRRLEEALAGLAAIAGRDER